MKRSCKFVFAYIFVWYLGRSCFLKIYEIRIYDNKIYVTNTKLRIWYRRGLWFEGSYMTSPINTIEGKENRRDHVIGLYLSLQIFLSYYQILFICCTSSGDMWNKNCMLEIRGLGRLEGLLVGWFQKRI